MKSQVLDMVSVEQMYLTFTASSWGKPQGKTLRNGFLHEALDEMTTPQTTKNDMMQSSGK